MRVCGTVYVMNPEGKKPLDNAFLLALVAAGLAGNYFRFPIFLDIDFLFGSIFAMLALQFLGPARGILAAAAIAGYTFVLWNHPYSIIIMTAEVAAVAWLMRHRRMGMVLADTLYWLLAGMPLAYLFHHVVMHLPASNTQIVMIKQAVNGIANALVARLLFTGYSLRSRSSLTSYREIVTDLLAFFVLFPALILLAVGSRTDFNEIDRRIRTTLAQDSQRMSQRMETWVGNRKTAILNLAEMAVTRSPQRMQPSLEQACKSDLNFLRIGLLDREATASAIFPPIDEFGVASIGKSFADRPFIPVLRQTLKPMLSEVVLARVGTPKPAVSVLAPVVIRGAYGGYVIGVLSLDQIKAYLDLSSARNPSVYTLLDKNGTVIMSNRPGQKVMSPFARGEGTIDRLDGGISRWVPAVHPNTSISERWNKSFYVAESTVGDRTEWRLILEQPVAPFQKMLYDNYTGKLTLLFLILLAGLALAELLGRRIVLTLEKLGALTYELPARLDMDAPGISWPESGFEEAHRLIGNFRNMAAALTTQFTETRRINASLEQRVRERTSELADVTNELAIIVENAPVGISKIVDRKQILVNRRTEEMFLYSKAEMMARTTRVLYPSDEAYEKFGREAYPVLSRGLVFETEQELIRKDGVRIMTRYIGKAIEPTDLSKGTIWLLEDITERKRADTVLRASLREKETLLKEIHHRVKNNMAVISSLLALQGSRIADPAHRAMFEESRQRIKSMALVHEKLYAAADLSRIDFAGYARSLVNGLEAVHHRPGRGIETRINVGDVLLDVDTAVPCGLILNELVTNALKYAFDGRAQGKLTISFTKRDGACTLTVGDDGIGLPAGFDPRKTDTLGLKIVDVLARQLGGEVRYASGAGTEVAVTFAARE